MSHSRSSFNIMNAVDKSDDLFQLELFPVHKLEHGSKPRGDVEQLFFITYFFLHLFIVRLFVEVKIQRLRDVGVIDPWVGEIDRIPQKDLYDS